MMYAQSDVKSYEDFVKYFLILKAKNIASYKFITNYKRFARIKILTRLDLCVQFYTTLHTLN